MELSTVLSIIGIMLAVLGFFVSPDWIKSAINKTILSNRQKRIDSLKENYDVRNIYKEHRDAWIAALIAIISSALYQLTIIVFWISIYTVTLIRNPEQSMIFSFNGFITFYFLFAPLNRFNSATRLHNDVLNLEDFKQKTIKKLKKLGLSMEEATELLDKEETET
jgi:CBS domain containing-hemolysin-like protein